MKTRILSKTTEGSKRVVYKAQHRVFMVWVDLPVLIHDLGNTVYSTTSLPEAKQAIDTYRLSKTKFRGCKAIEYPVRGE